MALIVFAGIGSCQAELIAEGEASVLNEPT
jgi:hypothetical protein